MALAAMIGAAVGCAQAPAPVEVRVGMYATTDMLPIYVMQARGDAARHGLRLIESTDYASGLAAAEALARDEIDVAYPGVVPLLSLVASGAVPRDVALLGANSIVSPDHPSSALLVAARVTSWDDLEGAQIATHNPNSVSAAAFAARAKAEGVTAYEFVSVGFVDMGLAVRDGLVAAAITDEPWTTQSVERGDGHILAYMLGEPPLEHIPVTALAVRRELLDDGTIPERFLRAHLDAVAFIAAHDAEARALIATNLGISPQIATQMTMKGWAADGRLDLASLDALQAVLVDAGVQPALVPAQSIYFPTTLETILGERR